jgi:tRNA threonylcarbamoyladenosine biosynthesis protein TsaB
MTEPVILHVETSAELCSVALSRGTQCVAIRENSEGRNHAAMLTLFMDELLTGQHLKACRLDAVAVSTGPGSYTGLRIGMSTAKGLCYGARIPLVAIPTLHAMAHGLTVQYPAMEDDALLCPMIDARRMEVYTALFDTKGNTVKDTAAEIITPHSFASWLRLRKIYFFGNGADKCKEMLTHPNACFPPFAHSAQYMIPDAVTAYRHRQFEDIAYIEPFYLKDFIAGKPKQML